MTIRNLVPVVGEVVEALRAQFSDPENPPVGGVVPEVEHRPGADVALDGLFQGDCPGLVWVNVTRVYRTRNFPVEEELATCRGGMVAMIEVGAARCVGVVDDMGYPPTVERMEQDALAGLDDAGRLERALCAANKAADERGLLLQSVWSGSVPHGPQGGVLAWTKAWTVHLS